jgi:hypothetical protein
MKLGSIAARLTTNFDECVKVWPWFDQKLNLGVILHVDVCVRSRTGS